MPCESSLEWLSVPYSLPWNAASCRPLQCGNALHLDCPLLFVEWQAASFIVKPQCGQCGLWVIRYTSRLSSRELSFHLRSMSANRGHRRRIDCPISLLHPLFPRHGSRPRIPCVQPDSCSHVELQSGAIPCRPKQSGDRRKPPDTRCHKPEKECLSMRSTRHSVRSWPAHPPSQPRPAFPSADSAFEPIAHFFENILVSLGTNKR